MRTLGKIARKLTTFCRSKSNLSHFSLVTSWARASCCEVPFPPADPLSGRSWQWLQAFAAVSADDIDSKPVSLSTYLFKKTSSLGPYEFNGSLVLTLQLGAPSPRTWVTNHRWPRWELVEHSKERERSNQEKKQLRIGRFPYFQILLIFSSWILSKTCLWIFHSKINQTH